MKVLDLLTTSASDRYSSRDSLQAKYAQIDPRNGVKRFEAKLEKRPRFTLPPKAQRFGMNYTILYDNPQNSLTQKFGVKSWPSKFLLDESGAVLMENGDGIKLELVKAYLANKEQQSK